MDSKVLNRIKQRDRIARWIITVGGLAIIFSVVLILVLIVKVTLPLFRDASADVFARFQTSGEVLAVGLDEYLETGVTVTPQGEFVFHDLKGGKILGKEAVAPPAAEGTVHRVDLLGAMTYAFLWNDGALTIEKIGFHPVFDEQGKRTMERKLERLASFPPPSEGKPLRSEARVGEETRVRVDLMEGNRLTVTQETVETDLLGNEKRETQTFEIGDVGPEKVTAFTLDGAGNALYAGTEKGTLLRWSLETAGSAELLDHVQASDAPVTALGVVLGDISVAVGDEKGALSTWFPVAEGEEKKSLRRIHLLKPHGSAVTEIRPSERDKSVLSLDRDGVLHLDHMTSERHLLTLTDHEPIRRFAFSSRGNGLLAIGAGGHSTVWSVDPAYPEISLKTLFGKVWYESYDQPAWVWQSSAANDDFEPKLSLYPLVFGTIKGTFFAMVFAIPLALLGAIYTSQFGSPRLRQVIKPAVEVMAAIPSVIIGFLAALWLAPLLETNIAGFFLSLGFLPTAFVLALLLWQVLRKVEGFKRVERGYEFLALLPVIVLAVALAAVLGPLFENLLFDGSFRQWLYTNGGVRYDQRNSIVISFALGFAVIPIIFTIAEDSLSNVPPSLRAASLAMGASRWQTVWRVILPSASPGIFAGIMIGLGRAVGETMIVLMATGNTPIIDWSAFNGMRPLSSNIAVEIPEAPLGGTLYRVLFLSAVILFVLTFILNTVAEVVRQRLRKKYGRF